MGLRSLLSNYTSDGFTVLAFPSNQFGGQAPCSSSCERAYAYHKVGAQSNFPVFDKVEVNGPTALETYTVLKHGSGLIEDGPPRELGWNYEKFLVASNGTVIQRYGSATSPLAAEGDIRLLLGLD